MTLSMNKIQNLSLALLSGILLSLAWPAAGFAPLLFVGFIPLLIAEENIFTAKVSSGIRVFLFLIFLQHGGLSMQVFLEQ